MLTCPMCKKKLPGMDKKCANCKTDVSLLVDYVENLRDGLVRAEALTKQGELGDAVWEYLEVLEVDPDNATARRQVGKVATAVRQFDQTAPAGAGRRSCSGRRPSAAGWPTWSGDGDGNGWLSGLFWFVARRRRPGRRLLHRPMGGAARRPRRPPPAASSPTPRPATAHRSERGNRGDFPILC